MYADVEMSDDAILQHSQQLRKRIIDTIVTDGVIPKDKDTQYVLLTALKDMDKQVIDKKRVAIDAKGVELAGVVANVANKISEMFNNKDPFVKPDSGSIPVMDHALLPDYTPVEGEVEIGITNDNYDSFMSVHGKHK